MNILYVVTRWDCIASRYDMDWRGKSLPIAWPTLPEAWRTLDRVLTWETQEGAQRFADMNGGTVRPLSEVFDESVILPTHGPLQHSPDEARPLEGPTRQERPE